MEHTYKKLDEAYKEKVRDWTFSLEVDETELESYRYEYNPEGVEPQYARYAPEWDETEYANLQVEEARKILETDSITDYVETDPKYYDDFAEWDSETLDKEVKDYLDELEEL